MNPDGIDFGAFPGALGHWAVVTVIALAVTLALKAWVRALAWFFGPDRRGPYDDPD